MDAVEKYKSNSDGEESDLTMSSDEDNKLATKTTANGATDLPKDSEQDSSDSSEESSSEPVPRRNKGVIARKSTNRRVIEDSSEESSCDLEVHGYNKPAAKTKQPEAKLTNFLLSKKRKVQSPNESESSTEVEVVTVSKQNKKKTVKSTVATSSPPSKKIGRPREFTEVPSEMIDKMIVKLKKSNKKAVEEVVNNGISIPQKSTIMELEKTVEDFGTLSLYESYEDEEGLEKVESKSLKNSKARQGLSAMVSVSIGVIDILSICDMDLFSSRFGIGINKHIQLLMSK